MKHIQPVSRTIPAKAQFEPLLQLVALLSSILALIDQASNFFDKNNEEM